MVIVPLRCPVYALAQTPALQTDWRRITSSAAGGTSLASQLLSYIFLLLQFFRRGRRLRRPARTSFVTAGQAVEGASPYNHFTNYNASLRKAGEDTAGFTFSKHCVMRNLKTASLITLQIGLIA